MIALEDLQKYWYCIYHGMKQAEHAGKKQPAGALLLSCQTKLKEVVNISEL